MRCAPQLGRACEGTHVLRILHDALAVAAALPVQVQVAQLRHRGDELREARHRPPLADELHEALAHDLHTTTGRRSATRYGATPFTRNHKRHRRVPELLTSHARMHWVPARRLAPGTDHPKTAPVERTAAMIDPEPTRHRGTTTFRNG